MSKRHEHTQQQIAKIVADHLFERPGELRKAIRKEFPSATIVVEENRVSVSYRGQRVTVNLERS